MKIDSSSYLSPFSWRYGSKKMRYIWSEEYKYKLWRKIWVALAKAQYKQGLVSKEELNDLKIHESDIDIDRIIEIEKNTKHDVVAAIYEFAEKAKIGGGKIHLGATSMDIDDNEDILRIKDALKIVEANLLELLSLFSKKVKKYSHLPCMGFTHLQTAEPTTVGYRLALYTQNLLIDLDNLQFVKKHLLAKGMKGAVGTSASYHLLVKNDKSLMDLDKNMMTELNMESSLITNQVYNRKIDYLVLSLLTSLTSTIAKFAGDLRILQSAPFGEWSEPFGKKQVGSSAMPFKKNPISSESICALARYISQMPNIAASNATHSYLERTLDDSANRRIIIPESFLTTDQILLTAKKIISGLIINEPRIRYNLDQYGSFAATEAILMEAVKNGADRQKLHEVLKEISMKAWQDIQSGKTNPMEKFLKNDPEVTGYVSKEKVTKLLDIKRHTGDAPKRSRLLVKKVSKILSKY